MLSAAVLFFGHRLALQNRGLFPSNQTFSCTRIKPPLSGSHFGQAHHRRAFCAFLYLPPSMTTEVACH